MSSDGFGMLPRAQPPESAMLPGMAVPDPGSPEHGFSSPSPMSMPDTSIGPVAVQQPARWTYDFDPANGVARATFPGEVFPLPSTIVGFIDVMAPPYNAVGNGIADDTAAINSAIAAAAAAGGAIVKLGHKHAISATLTVNASNVNILGYGSDISHDVGAQFAQAGTLLNWIGSAGGTMMNFASPAGAGNQKKNQGGARGIYFNGNGTAGRGLTVVSWDNGTFCDLYFLECTIVCLLLDVTTSLGEARDTQSNYFRSIGARQITSTGPCVLLQATTPGANPSFNYFLNCSFVTNNGDGWQFYDSDNNMLVEVGLFNVGGSGNGIIFNGTNGVGGAGAANSNVVLHCAMNKPVIFRGTETTTIPSLNNLLFYLDRANSDPAPQFGTGVSFPWCYTDGIEFRAAKGGLAVGSASNAAEINDAIAGIAGNLNCSMWITNDSDFHSTWTVSNQSVLWFQAVNSSSNDMVFTAAISGINAGINLIPGSAGGYKISGNKVVGARATGWTAMTGVQDKATAFDPSTVTLVQLAERVSAIQAALTTHGLIGT